MKIPYIKIPIADVSAYLAPFAAEAKGLIFQAVLDFGLYQKWPDLNLTEQEQLGYANIKEIVENEIKNYKKFCKEQKQKAKKMWVRKQNHDEAVDMPLRQSQTETKAETEYITTKETLKKSEPALFERPEAKPMTLAEAEFEEFWRVYPKQRIGNKDKARAAFLRAVKRSGLTAEQITAKAAEYAQGEEVARGYAKGAEAWLNDDRFLRSYGPAQNTSKTLEEARREGQAKIDEIFGGSK